MLKWDWTKGRVIWLSLFIILALSIRAYLAPSIVHKWDMLTFKAWSQYVTDKGFGDVYSRVGMNYPPIYLYFLYFIGHFYQGLLSPAFDIESTSLTCLVKIPAILADLLTSLIIFWLLRKRLSFRSSLFVAASYAFNPGIIYNSSSWGQTDSLHALFMLLAIIALDYDRPLWSWLSISLALLTKPQSVVLVPIIFVVTVKEHGMASLTKGLGIALITALVVCLPFIWSHQTTDLIAMYTDAVGKWPNITMNAYNLWYLLTLGRGTWNAREMYDISDAQSLVLGLSYRQVGFVLIGIFTVIVLYYLLTRYDSGFLYLASAAIAFVFFMLPTQIHERYMLPVFPFLTIVYSFYTRLRKLYLILSVTFFINLVRVAPFSPEAWHILESESIAFSISLVNTLALVFMVIFMACYKRGEETFA